jgi:hypothetical protein
LTQCVGLEIGEVALWHCQTPHYCEYREKFVTKESDKGEEILAWKGRKEKFSSLTGTICRDDLRKTDSGGGSG